GVRADPPGGAADARRAGRRARPALAGAPAHDPARAQGGRLRGAADHAPARLRRWPGRPRRAAQRRPDRRRGHLPGGRRARGHGGLGQRVSAQVATVRAWWRVKRPGRSLGTRLDALYMVAITTGIFGALLYGTASSALSQVITPEAMAEWGPAILLVGLALTARWGTWQGPVVFAEPDVGFLLGAPLSRRALAARPFARAVGWGAVAGALG